MAQRIIFPQETNIGNLADPQIAQDAATKNYVDNNSGGSPLPFDVIEWVNDSNVGYVSDKSVSQLTANIKALSSLDGTWEFTGLQTLSGFTDGAEVIGSDAKGKTISGIYTAGATVSSYATLTQVNYERSSGFVVGTLYDLVWRQGRLAAAGLYISNTVGSPVLMSEMGASSSITFSADASNLGRYIPNVQSSFVSPIADTQIATRIGSVATLYTNCGTTTVSTGFGNAGSTATIITVGYATAKAFLQTPLIGAIPVAGGLGNWTLPSEWPILVSSTATPTASQIGTIASIAENQSNSFLQLTITGNAPYFANLGVAAQPLFFFANPNFVFQNAPLEAINAQISSRAGGVFNSNEGNYSNVVVNAANVYTTSSLTGSQSSIVLSNGAANAQLIVDFFNARSSQALYRFSGSTINFRVSNVSLTSSSNATITLAAQTTFTPSVLVNSSLQYLESSTSFSDVALNSTLVGTVTTNVFGRQQLTLSTSSTAGVSSLNSITGAVNLLSSDGTVQVNPSGQNIDLRASPSSGAGVAEGQNIGPFIQSNIKTYAGAVDTLTDTQPNEFLVQIGSGTGFSTNSSIIYPGTTTQGWGFGGQLVGNVVAELSPQKQVFRIGVSGSWNVNLPNPYGSAQTSIVIAPLFLKEGADYNTVGGQFPGFVNAQGDYEVFKSASAVTATARYSLDLGKTVSNVAPVSTATVAGSTVFVSLITVNNTTNITEAPITLPLQAYIGGVWTYIGSEFNISNVSGNVLQVTLTTTLATLSAGVLIRIQNNASIPLISWHAGVPPINTSFGTATTNATGNGYVEVAISPNTWYLDSSAFSPAGFNLPSSPNRYNFSWQGFTPGIVKVNSIEYYNFNNLADSWYSPNASVNWNNSITANLAASNRSLSWTDYATRWSSVPTSVVSDGSGSDGTVSGNIKAYVLNSVTRYRFIPTTYSSASDAFYSNYTSATKTVSNIIVARNN